MSLKIYIITPVLFVGLDRVSTVADKKFANDATVETTKFFFNIDF